jgi:hypothetical protein
MEFQEPQNITYSGVCRTRKQSKFAEILGIDSFMVMLKELLPVAFHKLELRLIKEQIMNRSGSNYSANSSAKSEPKSIFQQKFINTPQPQPQSIFQQPNQVNTNQFAPQQPQMLMQPDQFGNLRPVLNPATG